MAPDIDPLSRLLGGLENQLTTVLKTLGENRIADAQYRTDVRIEIRSLSDNVQNLSADHKNLAEKVGEMRPVVRAGERAELQTEGAKKLLRFLWNAIIALISVGGMYLFDRRK